MKIGFSLFGFLIINIIIYIIGLIVVFKNSSKYKNCWKVVVPFLFLSPILIFVLNPFFMHKKGISDKKESIALLAFFLINNVILNIFFKYGMDFNYNNELSLFCSSLSVLLYLIIKYTLIRGKVLYNNSVQDGGNKND
jgi:hypothetical protein